MTHDELKEKANALPLTPGVYLMMDKTGKVIYVGKAKKLKNRVSQYFQDSASHTAKTRQMVSQVDHFDTIFVTSEFEALVLPHQAAPAPLQHPAEGRQGLALCASFQGRVPPLHHDPQVGKRRCAVLRPFRRPV